MINIIYHYNNQNINVVIIRKKIKNTYLRFRDGQLIFTTSIYTKEKDLIDILDKNAPKLLQQINFETKFYLWGETYDILEIEDKLKKIELRIDKLIISGPNRLYREKVVKKFYIEEVEKRLPQLIEIAKLDFPDLDIPELKISFFKSIFGSYNRRTHIIKLNAILAKFSPKFLKYILYHELSHLKYFNHQKKFYAYFEAHLPEYKIFKKELSQKMKQSNYFKII